MSSPPPSGPEQPESDRDPRSRPWPVSPARPRGPLVAPLSDPLVPPDLRGWLDRVCGVVRRSVVPLFLIQLCVAAVSVPVSYVLPPVGVDDPQPAGLGSSMAALALTVALAVGVVAQGASVYVAVHDAAGNPPSSRAVWRFAAERAPTLIGWGMAAALLTLLGCFMLIVPGLYLAIVFGASLTGVITIEGGTLVRCFELVNARFWATAGRMLLAVVAGAVYTLVAGYVVKALTSPGSLNEALLGAVVQIPLGIAAVGVAVVTYAELRFHERGEVFTATLAAELNRWLPRRPSSET